MIQVKTFVFNPFQENTHLIYDDTQKCIILDPGCYFSEEQGKITKFIADRNLHPEYIVHTHGHIDHALGTNFIKDHYHIQSVMHRDDLEILRRTKEFGQMIGVEVDQPRDPDIFIKEGENVHFGNTSLNVLHVPGHSPGSIALYSEADNKVFVGDALFKRSIGRTDLTGGDYITLIESIKNKLLTLKDDTVVYSGHGEITSIGEERAENPLLI